MTRLTEIYNRLDVIDDLLEPQKPYFFSWSNYHRSGYGTDWLCGAPNRRYMGTAAAAQVNGF